MSEEMNRSLTLLVHGKSKQGKSTIAATAPAPRLLLDVEKGARFLDIKAITWDPNKEEPPAFDGTWDTAVVHVNDYDTVLQAYQWLQSGSHPFKSVIVDSISELQAKVLEKVAGRNQVQTQQWGELLRHMAGFMRDLRDLTAHPSNPLTSVVVTSMSREIEGRMEPYLQGQSAVIAPYIYDITGYIVVEEYPHPDPTQGTYKVRRMYIESTPTIMAGERVGGRLGSVVEQDDLNVPKMIDKIYGTPKKAAAAAKPAAATAAGTTEKKDEDA